MSLVDRGADADSKNKDGRTPLHDAALEGHNGVVKTLLERGANVNALNQPKEFSFYFS
ncbi:ankyrin repeat domain-containing protein [Wolbachia endosymbiont of Diaphorina citri]|uniref:Ankyrin repeat domain-containing protein n=1 Tax=Wolbachia endosymbiont of Ephestia elutella TaxID=3231696 RepID=A0AAU8MNR3_9RICK|nr:ankyrin repeat domain-containing protein [Wolbachia endosymbiont of Diaphorina citri]QLK12110.1 ankyrin repeat domain-containing protein [Wolbachia endosymbiont of Diaphorina citri]QXY87594.1 ankyrin repeat domain-containing protein [Wolbachia endosymbiont of Diaphorina citri]QXY88795.1 ankyrin repeat domain-containing protein [Wolbachia endosymbiont of Diaphorina citri]QXY90080.1 ankyrin repeat domain-containing protein [Wolbachia endosymbiont of Diaphorina citri]